MAMSAPRRRAHSTVLLDLDETLVCSVSRAMLHELFDTETPPVADYTYDELDGFLRPHAVEFVRYCRRAFRYVVVLTAGTESYAAHIVHVLFEERAGYTPDAVLDRAACVEIETPPGAAPAAPMYVKPLSLIRTHLQHLDIDWDDAVLVDDLAINARQNQYHNALLLPKFDVVALHMHYRMSGSSGQHELVADTWLADLLIYLDRTLQTETKWAHTDTTFWFCTFPSLHRD